VEAEFAPDAVMLTDAHGVAVKAGEAAAAELSTIRDALEGFFPAAQGFGGIIRMNFLDGVRIWFSGGDIAHIRPSGNAPQLRIYAVAGDPARAGEIVRTALREPDGILRAMERGIAQASFLDRVRANIAFTHRLFQEGRTPEILGTVSGSEAAREFWQKKLDALRGDFKARAASPSSRICPPTRPSASSCCGSA